MVKTVKTNTRGITMQNQQPTIWDLLGACVLGALLAGILFWEYLPHVLR